MRKIFFTLIGVLLLSTAAFGSDVLFKMAPTTTTNASNTESGKDLNLAAYYHYYVGGSALVHNGQDKEASLVSSGIARVTNASGYIKITLPTGVTLQAGDTIAITNKSDDTKNTQYRLSKTAAQTESPAISASITDNHASYTIVANDDLDGQNVFYVNLGGDVTYVKSLTVSRPNDLVKFYSFEDLTPIDYTTNTTEGNAIVTGELYLNSDGTSSGSTCNGVKAVSSGKPQAIYMRGKDENRAARLMVTEPCTVEIWGWAANSAYYLSIAKGTYAQPASATKVLELEATNTITYSGELSYKYTDFWGQGLYLTPFGGFYIAAIRVTKTSPTYDYITSSGGSFEGGATSGRIWTSTSDNNYTFACDTVKTMNPISQTTGGKFTFETNGGLRLASKRTYKVYVPSDKIIRSVSIEAHTCDGSNTDGKIRINSGYWTGNLPVYNSGNNPTTLNQSINAQSFLIETNSRASLVEIKLLVEDLGYYPVSFGNNWASFCAPEDVVLPEGVYAYIASTSDGETITVNKVDGNLVPANTGVLLYSETLPACHVTATTGAPALDGNILQYTTARTARPASGTTYALNGDEGCFQEYTGNYIPANKAYVHMPSGAAPKRLRIVKGGDKVPTGVEAVSDQPSVVSQKLIENGQLVIIRDGVKYNVQGQIIK